MYEVSRKKAFAAVVLITIALTVMAWATVSVGTGTITIDDSGVTIDVAVPNIYITGKNRTGSVFRQNAINITNPYSNDVNVEIEVTLIDLGNLYVTMKSFTVTIYDGSNVYAVLTLEKPVAVFEITVFSQSTAELDMVVSWSCKSGASGSITYGVAAEVVGYP